MGLGWEGAEVLSFTGDKREREFSHFTERVCANGKVSALWGLSPGGFREARVSLNTEMNLDQNEGSVSSLSVKKLSKIRIWPLDAKISEWAYKFLLRHPR